MADVADILWGDLGARWRLRRAADVPVEPLRWLWEQRIPLGGVTLLPGREGLGKSLVAHDLAARVTRGILAGDLHEPADVIIVAAEDMIASVSAPRLIAAGADLDRVHYVEPAAPDDMATWVVPHGLAELDLFARSVERLGLVIIDPLDAHLDVDTHKKAETQRAIGLLSRFAQTHDCAIVGVAHHNKTVTSDPLRSVTGSTAFTSAVRSVISIAVHPDDPDQRVLAVVKSNLAAAGIPVLQLRIEGRTIERHGVLAATAAVVWTGTADVDLDAIFGPVDPDQRVQLAEARELLLELLADGARPAREVKAEARREGISERTLARARQSLSVHVQRVGFPSQTVWVLPSVQSTRASDGTTGDGTTGDIPETRLGGGS